MKINKIFLTVLVLVLALFALCSCEPHFGEKEYYEKDGLLYELAEGKNAYVLAGYTGEPEAVTVPGEIDGLPVIAVGNSAFYNAEKLVSVSLPDSIKKIDDYAFDNCYLLSGINFPESLEFIGFNAFSDCESIEQIILPDALTEIDSSAFTRCKALKSVSFGKSLETIGRDAFFDCDAITDVYIADLKCWSSVNFKNPLSNPLYFAENFYVNGKLATDIVISGVEAISEYAFYKFGGIISLTVKKGVSEIGISAFSECENLKKVTLEDGVAYIGTSAFSFCSSLEEISFGKGLKDIGGLAFYDCVSLKRVSIVDLRQWCEAHFYVDNSGTSNPLYYAEELVVKGKTSNNLVIPDGTTRISAIAFINCQFIKTVTLPKSIKEIEETAFYMSASVEKVVYRGTKEEWRGVIVGDNNSSFGYAVIFMTAQG